MKINRRKENGITLVALIITIVVILILTSVSIITIFGNDSVIKKFNFAKEKYENAQSEEEQMLELKEYDDFIKISGVTRDDVKSDLDAEVKINALTDTKSEIYYNINSEYNGAIYIYTLDGKIIEHTDERNFKISDIDTSKEHNVVVAAFEGDGTVHEYKKKFEVKKPTRTY